MGPNRYQCWWYSELLGWQVDAYPTPGQATARLEEVKTREHFTRGVALDMQEHLTSQEGYPTRREFNEHHKRFNEQLNHV